MPNEVMAGKRILGCGAYPLRNLRGSKMDIKTKALRTIEGICLLDEKPENGNFYRIAHVALGTCENPHEDWVKFLNNTYRNLKRNHII